MQSVSDHINRVITTLAGLWALSVLRMALLVLTVALSALPQAPLHAQSSKDTPQDAKEKLKALEADIKRIETDREKLKNLAESEDLAIKKISDQLVTIGRRIRFMEGDATQLERQIQELEKSAAKTQATLDARRTELADLTGALTSLSRRPAVTSLLRPGEAVDTARSAAVMGRLVPRIKSLADELSLDLKALTDVQDKLSKERFALKNRLEKLTGERLGLDQLLKTKQRTIANALGNIDTYSDRLKRMANEANSLRSLINKLEADAARRRPTSSTATFQPPEGFMIKPFKNLKGTLPAPLLGRIIKAYGDKDGAATSRGITIRSRFGAQVSAIHDGQIMFAGDYRGYGRLMIIAHGGGYYSLLAGMGALYGTAGQWVLAGEPVGTLPNSGLDANQLYLEIRGGGDSLDPSGWLNFDTE